MSAAAFDLTPARALKPENAVAAIIHTGDGRYLLQHRDPIPTIFYPDHWGCFGGAIDPGESPDAALARELREELDLDTRGLPVKRFSHFNFSVEPIGLAALDRTYFEVLIQASQVGRFRLGEGTAMELVDGREALHRRRLVPYDGFALWLHYFQGMLTR